MDWNAGMCFVASVTIQVQDCWFIRLSCSSFTVIMIFNNSYKFINTSGIGHHFLFQNLKLSLAILQNIYLFPICQVQTHMHLILLISKVQSRKIIFISEDMTPVNRSKLQSQMICTRTGYNKNGAPDGSSRCEFHEVGISWGQLYWASRVTGWQKVV